MNQKITEKRLIDGLLLVNKPKNMTSNAVLQQVKRLLRAKKAGHTGSLDPLATGMLPICFGEATKFSQYLLDADKCYEVTGLLGIKTNTSDAMGEVIAQVEDFSVSNSALETVLSQFSGALKQIPSMFSALKHQGKPLYKFARQGIDIQREARDIHIHELILNAFNGREFKLTVTCSKGTYIRNLVEDIGDALGVGAHVTQLHRVYTAGLAEERMYDLEELANQTPEDLIPCLLPVDRAIQDLPIFVVPDYELQALQNGKCLSVSSDATVPPAVKLLRLYDTASQFLGLGEWDAAECRVKPKRLLVKP